MENWLCVQKAFRSQSLNNKGRIAPCHPTAGTTRLSIVWDKHATSFLIVKALDSAVWPNVAVKSSPNVSKSCPPKSRRNSFYQKVIFQNRPKVTKIWATFVKKFDIEWFKKFPKCSHTGQALERLKGENETCHHGLRLRLETDPDWERFQ